jgi:uncharacterized protein YndB with AHSA1/START domain
METLQQELLITRIYNAPRELVYKAWTDAEAMTQWWGPKDTVVGIKKLEFRPGGRFHYSITMPDGMVIWGLFVYRDMLEPEHITYVMSFSDEDGKPAPSPFHQAWPLEILHEVSFDEQNGKTTLTLKAHPINAAEEEIREFFTNIPSMNGGYNSVLDKLEEYLADNQ